MIVGAIYIIIAMAVGFGVGFAVAQIGRSQPTIPTDLQVVLDQKIHELAEHKQEVANHFIETSNLVRNMTDSYRGVLEHLNRGAEKLVGELPSGNPLELAGHASLLESQHEPLPQQLPEAAAKSSSVVSENTEDTDTIISSSKAASPEEATDLPDTLAAKQVTADEQTSYGDTEEQVLASSRLKDNSADETLVAPATRDVVENVQHQADTKQAESVVEQQGEVSTMQAVASDDVVKPLAIDKVNAEQTATLVESTSKVQSEVVGKTAPEESKLEEALSVEAHDLAAAKITVDYQDELTKVSSLGENEVKEDGTEVWRREDGVEVSSLVNASMANDKSSSHAAPS